jgi:TatA/E family protein of Tat protein translocase
MFGPVGGSEFLILLVLALLLFGPRKLPQIGKTLGKALAEFRSATNEFRSSLERDVERERVREERPALAEVRPANGRADETDRPAAEPAAGARDGAGDGGHGVSGGEPVERS